MKKILFLNPPFIKKFSRTSRSPERCKGNDLYYPYWLAYCCGVLEKEGFKAKIIDAPARGYNEIDVLKAAKNFKPDLTVVDTSTPSIYNDVKVAEVLKSETGTFITLVGTHPTALPEEFLRDHKIDSVARGEYDYTIRDLAFALESGKPLKKVKGLSFRYKEKIIHNPDRPLIKNLDELPFVSKVYKKHLNIRDYFYLTVYYPEVTILTARGCKFQCGFCTYANVFWKGSQRFRSVENVVDEIEWIEDNLAVKEIMFEDATFSASYTKKRVEKLCKEMINRDLSIGWVANSRADVDYETLKIMKKAGCRLLCVGYESGDQAVLNGIPKGLAINQAKKFTKNAEKAGIKIHACFVLGLPGETKKTVEKTIEFSLSLNVDTVQYYPPNVVPGTPVFEWAKKNGYLKTQDWSKWLKDDGTHACVLDRPELPADYLEKKCDEALKRFYFRPQKIGSIAWDSLRNVDEFRRYFMGFKSFMDYLKGGFK